MTGVKALRKIQLGAESTPGTAVAATALWRGMGSLEDVREVVFVEEDVGLLPGTDRTYIPKLEGTLEMESTPATFEQLPYLFLAGVEDVSGVQDGTGTDYIYTFDLATTAQNTIQTYTIETGDDQQAEEMEYCFVTELTLEGVAGEALMMGATWLGRQVSNTTFTGAIAIPSVDEILFSKGKIYIDAIGGTIGTTQVTNSLVGMSLSLTTGLAPVYTADGDLFFTFQKQVAPELTVEVTWEHDANAVTRKGDFRNETARLIRLEFEGPAVATPGTTYSNKTLILDMAAKIESISALEDADGNDQVTMTYRARYNVSDAFFAQFIVVNELSAIP